MTRKDFRSTHFYITTTLLDSELYPVNEIANLYFQRWDVELSLSSYKNDDRNEYITL